MFFDTRRRNGCVVVVSDVFSCCFCVGCFELLHSRISLRDDIIRSVDEGVENILGLGRIRTYYIYTNSNFIQSGQSERQGDIFMGK